MEEGDRRPDGTFRKGVSGNPNGRPRKHRRRHGVAQHNARAAIDVAELPVSMTVKGKETETTLFHAVLLGLGHDALNGDKAARREFLRLMTAATATNQLHTELVQALVERDAEEEEELRQIISLFPDPGVGGTAHQQADGSFLPARWSDALARIRSIDQKEAELVAREKALARREDEARQRAIRQGDSN